MRQKPVAQLQIQRMGIGQHQMFGPARRISHQGSRIGGGPFQRFTAHLGNAYTTLSPATIPSSFARPARSSSTALASPLDRTESSE